MRPQRPRREPNFITKLAQCPWTQWPDICRHYNIVDSCEFDYGTMTMNEHCDHERKIPVVRKIPFCQHFDDIAATN